MFKIRMSIFVTDNFVKSTNRCGSTINKVGPDMITATDKNYRHSRVELNFDVCIQQIIGRSKGGR